MVHNRPQKILELDEKEMALTNLEIHWLTEELTCLQGCFFEKMQDIKEGHKFRFTAHDLIIALPERIHLTRYPYTASTPSNLAMYARKHLKGSKVKKVSQQGFDRVITIELENGFSIIIELFAKGNIIITNENKTKHCLRRESWKDREIKPTKEYKYPQSNKLNPKKMTQQEFNEIFKIDTIRSLVKNINMSGKYLEEVCRRAKVDKLSKNPSGKEKTMLFKEIKKLLEEHKPGLQSEPVATKLTIPEDYTPKETLNQAIDDYYSPEENKEIATFPKLEKRLKKQEESLQELKKRAIETKQKGDLIYAHFNELQTMLAKANQLKKQGKTWKEIETELGITINTKTRKTKITLSE